MLTINRYVKAFEDPDFQLALGRLYQDLGNQDPEEWARGLYLLLRDHPLDPRARSLNQDRKTCLDILYQLVDAWEASPDPRVFEQEIVQGFQVGRIKQILQVCLVMDRAQSLYKMQITNSTYIGMHWYSKLHLTSDSSYAKAHYQEKAALDAVLFEYEGGATMNKRLFKLFYTESFGLLEDTSLARWSRPQLATFVEQHTNTNPIPAQDSPAIAPSMDFLFPASSSLSTHKASTRNMVLKFVSAYDDPGYQACLERLHRDKGSQNPEEWARKLYLEFRGDPANAHIAGLNQDRKHALRLLYDLVNAWQEHGPEFECAMHAIFKVRRIARILSVCLVMDRAQSLFKMAMPAYDGNGVVVGMHWFCELHVRNNDLTPEWAVHLSNYPGRGTMNKRLYWLLHSELLGLQENSHFAKWSKPQAAEFAYEPGHAQHFD